MSSYWLSGSKREQRETRMALLLRGSCRCVYCGVSGAESMLTLDHIVARNLGGDWTDPANLVAACRSCNASKSDRTIRAWYRELRARGIDTDRVSRRVRRQAARDLTPYREQARALLLSDETPSAPYRIAAAVAAK